MRTGSLGVFAAPKHDAASGRAVKESMPVFRTSALVLLLLVYCEPALSCVDAHFYCRSDYAASGKCSDHRRLACLLTCSNNCAPSCARLVAPPPYPPPPYPPGSGDCADLCSTAKNEVCETKASHHLYSGSYRPLIQLPHTLTTL